MTVSLMKVNESWNGMARDTLHPSDGHMLLLLSTRKEGLELKEDSVLPKDLAVIVAIDIFKPLADTSIPFRSRVILMPLAPLADSRSDFAAVTDILVLLEPLGTAEDDNLILSPTSSTSL
jgi:hypothetical protein